MPTQETSDYFDHHANTWDVNQEIIERNALISQKIRETIPLASLKSALEIGAGTGQLGIRLAPYLTKLLLLDGSPKMVELQGKNLAQAGLTNVVSQVIELGSADFPEGNFDFVYSAMAFHHILDIPGMLANIARQQHSGDWLVIIDLVTEDGSFHAHAPELPVHQGFDPRELSGLLIAAGYDIKHNQIVYHIQRPQANQTVKSYPLFMIVATRR